MILCLSVLFGLSACKKVKRTDGSLSTYEDVGAYGENTANGTEQTPSGTTSDPSGAVSTTNSGDNSATPNANLTTDAPSFGAGFPKVDLSNGIKVTNKKITLVTCLHGYEVSGTQAAWNTFKDKWAKKYPNISISVQTMTNGDAKLMSMIAAGNGPDLIRLSGFQEIPSLSARGLLLPLDRYFEAAKVNTADFMPVMDLYRYDGKERGKGCYYGVVKDFSIDNMIWVNKSVFKSADVELPSTTTPLTYSQLSELAKKLTVREGDVTKRYGITSTIGVLSLVEAQLQSNGKSLWNANGTKGTLTSAATQKAIDYWADLAQAGAMPSTLNPTSDSVGFGLLVENKTAMMIGGYWLGTGLATYGEDKADNLMLIPAPVEEGGRTVNSALEATGIGIYSGSKNPNEAFLLLKELLLEEDNVKSRAETGWGVPGIKSAIQYLPDDTAARKQYLDVTLAALNDYSTAPKVSNYCLYSGFNAAFMKQYNMYLYGKNNLKDAMKRVDSDVQLLVEEGMEYTK